MNNVEKVTVKLPLAWHKDLLNEFNKPYFIRLLSCLEIENNQHKIYPRNTDIFKAFELTPYSEVKVVVIGQDPYHGLDQANGLAFSVNTGIKLPPSLKNIFKELKRDLNIETPKHGNLEKWATQGVLLINSTLTVRAGTPNSHQQLGWNKFTDSVIQLLSAKKNGIVFLLWGKFAQEKEKLINHINHHILISSHPSPFSAHRGFIGSNHFSKTNLILKSNNISPINWDIS